MSVTSAFLLIQSFLKSINDKIPLMKLPILISNRLSKILGNLLKAFGYVFHFFFPKKRFTIPKYAPAIIKCKKESTIPKIFWQTNYTNVVSLPVYLNYLFNRLMSLNYEYRYASNEDILELFEKEGTSEQLEAYKKLNDGAAKADFWRIFALNHFGGVYLDIDANFVYPLSSLIKADEKEVFLKNKQHYTNYFIAAAPNNEVLKEAIAIVVKNIQENKVEKGVYALTGPDVINIAIGDKNVNERFYRYVCVQGSFTNEYFHYIDKPRGKWIHTKNEEIMSN